MKSVDPGHLYELAHLDGEGTELLRFVKRVGDGYPGNDGPAYAGTNLQEVLRALIDRLKYVRDQARGMNDRQSVVTDDHCIEKLRDVLGVLEARAQRRHGRAWPYVGTADGEIEDMPTCSGCGHIGCEGACGRRRSA